MKRTPDDGRPAYPYATERVLSPLYPGDQHGQLVADIGLIDSAGDVWRSGKRAVALPPAS